MLKLLGLFGRADAGVCVCVGALLSPHSAAFPAFCLISVQLCDYIKDSTRFQLSSSHTDTEEALITGFLHAYAVKFPVGFGEQSGIVDLVLRQDAFTPVRMQEKKSKGCPSQEDLATITAKLS